MKEFLISLFIFFSVSPNLCSETISYQDRSLEWHKRNDHLIPDEAETENILKLNQDYSKPWRSKDDWDGDGIANNFDPSPYDWREIGYNPFGVLAFLHWNHPWNSYKYNEKNLGRAVRLIKEAGIRYVRFDFLWEDIEPYPGEFHFSKYDYIVNLFTENQIRILGILNYSTSWAAPAWNHPPENLEDFTNYASVVINRYKDKIKYWEVWNEPDSYFYWTLRDDMKTYTELLKLTYRTAKGIDPSCKILLGGLTNQGIYALKSIYRNGGKDYFDIVNIHPFTNPLYGNRLKSVRIICKNLKPLMAQFNDAGKKIWFTEIGTPGVKKPDKTNNWWEGRSPTQHEQANWVKEIYTELIKLEDVEKIFWAYLRDNKEHFKSGVDYFGLIRWDFSKKPAYKAYHKCTRSFKPPL